jgi:hypothetical protein
MFQDPRQAGGPFIPQPGDWATQEQKIKRTLALAEALRQQGNQPEGQMVSGHYVAPSWAEQILPVFNQFQAGWSEREADKGRAELERAQQAESEGWMQAMPKQQNVPFQAPGIDEADAAAASQGMQTVTKPTQQENLAWAQRGMRNPLSRTLAQMQMGEFVKEPEREEARAFRKEEAATNRAQALQLAQERAKDRLAELTARLEDRGLDRASREAMAREARALQGQIASMQNETRRYLGELAAETKKEVAGGKETPVPDVVMRTVRGAEEQARGLDAVASSYKPEYGGVSGAIDKISGTWNPFSGKSSEEAANWWKDYENRAALVERHEKFGTALSAGERAAWQAATIAPGMKPDVIEKNIKTRAQLAKTFYDRTRQQYIDAGHKGVGKAFHPMGEEKPKAPGGFTIRPAGG